MLLIPANEMRQFDYEHSNAALDAKTKLGYFFFSLVVVYAFVTSVCEREKQMFRTTGVVTPEEGMSDWIAPLLFVFFTFITLAIFLLLKANYI